MDDDIVNRIRESEHLLAEWQVVNIKTDGIVIWFGSNYLHPEELAQKWLADHAETHRTHEVRRVLRHSVRNEAADEIVRLRAEVERIKGHIHGALSHAEAGYEDSAWRCLASLVGPNVGDKRRRQASARSTG